MPITAEFCALTTAGSQPVNDVLLFKFQMGSNLPTNKQYLTKSL